MNEKQTPTKSPSENRGEETHHGEAEKAAKVPEKVKKESIKTLNDLLRTTFVTGEVLMTEGISQLDAEHREEIITLVRSYSDFNPENDPHGEHDFGVIKNRGETVYWKIDYYDKAREYLSPDPSDPSVTIRVLTIMLSSEY